MAGEKHGSGVAVEFRDGQALALQAPQASGHVDAGVPVFEEPGGPLPRPVARTADADDAASGGALVEAVRQFLGGDMARARHAAFDLSGHYAQRIESYRAQRGMRQYFTGPPHSAATPIIIG